VPTGDALRSGELVVWVGCEYVEEGVGSVVMGAQGTFITTDFGDRIVVSFEPVGAFSCRREDVRRVLTLNQRGSNILDQGASREPPSA
jgi:hypothetical protein